MPEPSALAPPRREPGSGRRLSEGTALGLSLGVTAAAWSMILVDAQDDQAGGLMKLGLLSAFLGPSTGHWYRGAPLTRGMLTRALGVAGFLFVFAVGGDCEGDSCDTVEHVAWGGLALFAIGTIDDIVTAPHRVRTHNQRLEGVSLAPIVSRGSAGLALAGRF